MTTDLTQAASASARMPGAPYSRTLRVVAGASLVLAGLLNGATQYVGHLLIGDLDFSDQIRWGADHPVPHTIEQALLLLVSALFMPIGLLGVAHVCRFRASLLTAVATPLVLWRYVGFPQRARRGVRDRNRGSGHIGR